MTYRVLIVDDQREVSRLLKSALETIEQGLEVAEARSGEEAILEARRKGVDLLVADFRLPGMTGAELMKKFHIINPQIKIIMITGVSDPRLLQEAQSAGADAFFTKPVSIADFLDTVERLLGMARTIVKAETKPPFEPPLEEEGVSLSSILAGLRQDLQAQAVVFIDGMGRVQAEAGQLPDPNNTVSLISSLMGMFNAAQKVAHLLNRAGNHLHLFDNHDVDGIFLPVGPSHALLLVGQGVADPAALAGRLERIFAARDQLIEALKSIGIPVEPVGAESPAEPRPATEEIFTQPENLPRDFLDILNQVGKKPPVDPNAFWETVVEKGTTYTEPDKLTYEQALKLGLAPDSAQ